MTYEDEQKEEHFRQKLYEGFQHDQGNGYHYRLVGEVSAETSEREETAGSIQRHEVPSELCCTDQVPFRIRSGRLGKGKGK